MPIVTPGKRPGVRLSKSKVFGKKMARKKAGAPNLLLTPMVDMFTIIVIYLIQNFSAEGEILFMSKDIKLPNITATLALEKAPVVGISNESILVNGQFVVNTDDITRDDTWNIPALEELLLEERKKIEQSNAMRAGGGEAFKGLVNVQADRKLPFKVLKKVMFACNQAGFGNINFAGTTIAASDSSD